MPVQVARRQDARVPRPRTRRTQEERRAETQAKLLDATIDSVLEVGYERTTTRRVAQVAGVSAGAQAYHYPRRVDLVVAAVERLAERRIAEVRAHAKDLPADLDRRVPALLDLLWADFSSPIFTVFVKLWVAAADDPELYRRLAESEGEIARAIATLVVDVLGEVTDTAGWQERVLVALAAVRGLALTEGFEPRATAQSDLWPAMRAALIGVFEDGKA
jgi:AcrR family transcriptional regulator